LPTGTSQEAFLEQIRKPWLARLSELPQAIWLRRLGTVSNAAPFTSRTAPGCSPRSQPSSRPWTTLATHPIVSEQSLRSSFATSIALDQRVLPKPAQSTMPSISS
jgi:hypothetical protein